MNEKRGQTTDTFTNAQGRHFIAGMEVPHAVWERFNYVQARPHPECPDTAICVCRDNGRRALLDDLYEAVHGTPPPAMPQSPAQVWHGLLGDVRQRFGR